MCTSRNAGQAFGDLKVRDSRLLYIGCQQVGVPCLYKCKEIRVIEEKWMMEGKTTCCVGCDVVRKMEKTGDFKIIPYNTDVSCCLLPISDNRTFTNDISTRRRSCPTTSCMTTAGRT